MRPEDLEDELYRKELAEWYYHVRVPNTDHVWEVTTSCINAGFEGQDPDGLCTWECTREEFVLKSSDPTQGGGALGREQALYNAKFAIVEQEQNSKA
jgi:hypothetical protein